MNVDLAPELEKFINKKVSSGEFLTESDFIAQLVRSYKDDPMMPLREFLESRLEDSEDEDVEFDFEKFLANKEKIEK
jgi:Arc/MetJ-type ribon-helix-helix transcriptional regulator